MKFAKKRWSVLTVFIAAVCALLFTACASTQTDKVSSSGNGIVSIEKTGGDGHTDTYTMKFTDGTTFNFDIKNGSDGSNGKDGNDGSNGADGKSAYELFKKYNPNYAGTEEMWLHALVNGKLTEGYIENAECVITVTVTDEAGNPLKNVLVTCGDFSYLTSMHGKCEILSGIRDQSIKVEKSGYRTAVKRISSAVISDAGKRLAVDCVLESLGTEDGYRLRGDKYMYFEIPADGTIARYYWYVAYESTGIRVVADVLDEWVVSSSPNLGMNDNIEFTLQKNTVDTELSSGNSFNVLVTLGADGMWARFAKDKASFAADISARLVSDGLFSVMKTYKNKMTDGYDGYCVDVFMDYALWNVTYSEAVGNFTIAPAARNGAMTGTTLFRSYVGYDCIFGKAFTNVRILADGTPTENFFALPDFDEGIKNLPDYENGTSLTADSADLTSVSASARKYCEGVPLFADRTYFADKYGLPSVLDGMSYLYGALEKPRDFTVIGRGYVAVAVPGEGRYSVDAASYLIEHGFRRIAANMPVLGHSTSVSYMTEKTDYYVKMCEVGENYILPVWGVVFFAGRNVYDKNNWETVPATVTVIDGYALAAKYAPSTQSWQGIPGIECVTRPDGGTRLFACWFTGMDKEPRVGNYAVVYYCDDLSTWYPAVVIGFDENTDAGKDSRVFDPSLFKDDSGNLQLWWNQTNATFAQVTSWYVTVTNAAQGEVGNFAVSDPVMSAYGLKMNKPVKLSTGEWLYCAHDFTDPGKTKVYSSVDKGKNWNLKGIASVPNARFANETTLVETTDDGSPVLVMYNRCTHSYNVAVSYSYDMGATWTDGKEFYNLGPSSRLNAITLASGNILYVHHYNTESRNNLCVFLSVDGGKTLSRALVLDTRYDTAYPDITVDGNGDIYIIWDYNRYIDKQILMTTITESELLAIDGVAVLDKSRIKVVSSLTLADMRADIAVNVYDADGNAVADALVTLSAPFFADVTVITDAYGKASFGNLLAEEYVVTAVKNGHYAAEAGFSANMFVDSMNGSVSLDLTLEKCDHIIISGVVTDLFSGEPVAGANVSAGGVVATTDENGGYELNGVPSRTETLTIRAGGYDDFVTHTNGASGVIDASLIRSDYEYIGIVGGGTANAEVNNLVWSVYLARDGNGLDLVGIADGVIPDVSGLTLFQLWINVDTFGSYRTEKTAQIDFLSNSRSRSYNYPTGKNTLVHGLADNTANGIAFSLKSDDVTVLKASLTYAALSKACGNAPIGSVTPLGVNLLAGVKVGNSWNYSEWKGENIPQCETVGVLSRSDPSKYMLFKANGSLTELARSINTTEELDAVVGDSAIGGHGILSQNMASFDITSSNIRLQTVMTGNYMFDDRTVHCFNGKQLKALDGMSYLYDGVTEYGSVTVTSPGYLLMYATVNAPVDKRWTKIIDTVENPGVQTSYEMALYALYAERGETVYAVNDGILMTNAIATELLVFGDSYTDAHVRGFWKNWDENMKPYGAKTIGISGSRIDTPTASDPYGWTERARRGEISAYGPKRILINLGVNDIDNGTDGRTSAAQLKYLLDLLRAQMPDADIYYTLIVDNVMFPTRRYNYDIHNRRIAEYAAGDVSGKLHIIDYRSELYVSVHGVPEIDVRYFADTLHLNESGYELWLKHIYTETGIERQDEKYCRRAETDR